MKQLLGIFRYIHINKGKLIFYITCSLLATVFSMTALGMLSPFMQLIINGDNDVPINSKAVGGLVNYIQQLRDNKSPMFALGVVCCIILISNLISNIFRYLSYYISTPVRNEVLSSFRIRLYEKILKLPLGYFSEQKKGDLMNRMIGDVGEIQATVISAMEGLIKDPLTIISYLIYMVYLSPMLSLALLLLLPVTAFIIGRISKKLKHQSNAYSVASGQNLSHVEETLSGIKVIKVFTAEDSMLQKFKAGNRKIFSILNAMTRRRDLASPLTEVMGVAVLCVILFIGGYLVFNHSGDLQKADLFPFIAVFGMVINPAKNLSNTISNIQRGMGAIARVEEILNAPEVIENKNNAVLLEGFNQSIEFREVSFSYGAKQVLQNINIRIEKGKTIALAGSSGAGKSTLVDLLPRFHDVTGGEILLDGIDIKDCNLQSLRRQMSFVTQEPVLFNDTIAANIALGNPNASMEQIEAAAKIANAHQFIMNKENGYHTIIGDRGMKLSGGERQRITIARAVLQNPPILILDEATSSLDTESERMVQDAIINLMKDRTSLVIAHRLSTIRHADEIIVMQHGQIIERGTHESLVAQNGFYKKLVEMQEIK
ncbi:MAG TPA: ABC transporter ATP-binding protein [Ferruginibacter sp.]|nr:ABC transporter ATP-binding protein [Ferruginibacter sp.]HMP20850.1 ABC transporter ATP-binding protein [Ferruginibacter sp.]